MKKIYKVLLLSTSAILFINPIYVNAHENEKSVTDDFSNTVSSSDISEKAKDVFLSNEVRFEKEKEYLTDEQLQSISKSKFIEVYNEMEKSNLFNGNIEDVNKTAAKLLTEPSNILFAKSYLPDSYEQLTDAEKSLVKSHPCGSCSLLY